VPALTASGEVLTGEAFGKLGREPNFTGSLRLASSAAPLHSPKVFCIGRIGSVRRAQAGSRRLQADRVLRTAGQNVRIDASDLRHTTYRVCAGWTMFLSKPNVNLGDSRHRIRTEMNSTHKPDEVAAPEVVAKAWDDYLHLFGAEAYVLARYGPLFRDATLSLGPVRQDLAAAGRSRPVRAARTRAA
jgi:hypothetical protein